MLALACEYRIAFRKGENFLNEIIFGSSVFAGVVDAKVLLKQERPCSLLQGTMYSAQAASQLGMIDQVSSDESYGRCARCGKASAAKMQPLRIKGPSGRWQTVARKSNRYRSLWTSGTRVPGEISKHKTILDSNSNCTACHCSFQISSIRFAFKFGELGGLLFFRTGVAGQPPLFRWWKKLVAKGSN